VLIGARGGQVPQGGGRCGCLVRDKLPTKTTRSRVPVELQFTPPRNFLASALLSSPGNP
jgi:hypothetical protein